MRYRAVSAVVTDFDKQTSSGIRGEVDLFRALLRSLRAAPGVEVEEYHGSGHQVSHQTIPEVNLGRQRCELSDLMIVVSHRDNRIAPRLTFLQAKYERGIRTSITPPSANYVQWSLLAGRPAITGAGRFRPPQDLLSGAALPSVGTFGFFVDGSLRGAQYDLIYASADALVPVHMPPTNQKYGRLMGLHNHFPPVSRWYPGAAATVSRNIGGMTEVIAAPTLEQFLFGLFGVQIGSPITTTGWAAAPWLAAELRRMGGRLAAELAGRLDDWLHAQGSDPPRGGVPETPSRDDDGPARVPARAVLLLRVGLELDEPQVR